MLNMGAYVTDVSLYMPIGRKFYLFSVLPHCRLQIIISYIQFNGSALIAISIIFET